MTRILSAWKVFLLLNYYYFFASKFFLTSSHSSDFGQSQLFEKADKINLDWGVNDIVLKLSWGVSNKTKQNKNHFRKGFNAICYFGKMKVYTVYCRFGKKDNLCASTSFRRLVFSKEPHNSFCTIRTWNQPHSLETNCAFFSATFTVTYPLPRARPGKVVF